MTDRRCVNCVNCKQKTTNIFCELKYWDRVIDSAMLAEVQTYIPEDFDCESFESDD